MPRPAASGRIRVVFGPDGDLLEGLVGSTVARTRRALAAPFNLPTTAVAFVNGEIAFSSYRLRVDDHLEFIVPWGRKGADELPPPGPLLTVKEAAQELRCSISFVYKLMQSGQLSFEQRGRRRLPLSVSVAEYRRRTTCLATEWASRPTKAPRLPYQPQRLFQGKRPKTGD